MPIRIKVRKAPSVDCTATTTTTTITTATTTNTTQIVQQPKKLKYIRTDTCFQCPHCEFTSPLDNQSTMHYHMKKHDNFLPHKCKHCNMRFLQKSLLDFHITARHSNDAKKIPCPCETCKYEDLRKGNVVIHFLRMHLKDCIAEIQQPSQQEGCVAHCVMCNASFTNMTGFLYHASNCISVPENHEMFSSWSQIKTS